MEDQLLIYCNHSHSTKWCALAQGWSKGHYWLFRSVQPSLHTPPRVHFVFWETFCTLRNGKRIFRHTEKACYPNSESCPHSVIMSADAIQRNQERTLVQYQSRCVKVSPRKWNPLHFLLASRTFRTGSPTIGKEEFYQVFPVSYMWPPAIGKEEFYQSVSPVCFCGHRLLEKKSFIKVCPQCVFVCRHCV